MCGPLGVEGDLSRFPVGLLPVDCVVRVTVSMTVVGVVPNRAAKRDQDYTVCLSVVQECE